MKPCCIRLFLLAGLALFLPAVPCAVAQIDAISWQVGDNAEGEDWNTDADWVGPTSPDSGNLHNPWFHFHSTAGMVLRSPAGGDDTFGGNRLKLVSGSMLYLEGGGPLTYTFNLGGFELDGGLIEARAPAGDWTFDGLFSVTAPSTLDFGAAGSSGLTIDAVFSGAADLVVRTAAGIFNGHGLVLANPAGTYSGTLITEAQGVLDFDYDAAGFGLNLNTLVGPEERDYGGLRLDQDLTVTSFTIGGAVLGPGTYSFETLNADYDQYILDGGSGSVRVVPEPSVLALLALAAPLLLSRRRAGPSIGIRTAC